MRCTRIVIVRTSGTVRIACTGINSDNTSNPASGISLGVGSIAALDIVVCMSVIIVIGIID